MDQPPQYASTYGALYLSKFHVKRADMPDVALSTDLLNISALDIDQKWPEYTFAAEKSVSNRWENIQKIKEMELDQQKRTIAEFEEKKRIEEENAAARAAIEKAEAEAEALIRSRAAAAAEEQKKKEEEAEAKIRARAEATQLAKQKSKQEQEKAEFEAKLNEVCSVTGLSREQAEKSLEKANGDSSQAIHSFFDETLSPSNTNLLELPLPPHKPTTSPISSPTSIDRERDVANLERIERLRQEDRLMAARFNEGNSSNFHTKDRSIQDLLQDYGADAAYGGSLNTLSPSSTSSLTPLQAPAQPFTAPNPLVPTDPFSSMSPRPAVASTVTSVPEGVPPPVYPQPPAYTSIASDTHIRSSMEIDFPREHLEKVNQLMALTQASESECRLLLICEGFDIDRACDSFFSGK